MYVNTLLFAVLWRIVGGQFPPNGDPGALKKMEAVLTYVKKAEKRAEAKEGGLAERAIHRMKAAEKAETIQEFISRGSLFLPGEDMDVMAEVPTDAVVLKFNEDIGEQVIDPRTPQGFGNPFFRQIHVEQAVEVRALLSEHEEKMLREAKQPLKPVIRSGWTLARGKGSMASPYERNPEFIMNLLSSPNMIIRRVCESCHVSEYKEIYYKRLTLPTKKSTAGMINGPMDSTTINTCFSDYTLHSSYEEAIAGANPWTYCADSNFGFPANSGPTSGTTSLHEKQYNGGSDGQSDWALYVEESAWLPIAGYGLFHISGNRNGKNIEQTYIDNALQTLHESGNGIVRMMCTDCEAGYQDVYYKRITAAPDDLMSTLLYDFKSKAKNILNRDFKIFSSYEDAMNSTNAWEVCETPSQKMAFPAQCKPNANATTPTKFHRAVETALHSRDDASTNRNWGFYVEADFLPETAEWMSESDEMKAFLDPISELLKDDDITCESASYDDTGLDQINLETHYFGINNLVPYVLEGGTDKYSGWYDVTGCGKCNDWCGWFLPKGQRDFVQINPYYRSWLERDHVFACITSATDKTFNYLRTSGIDSNEYLGGVVDVSMYPEFSNHQYTGWLKFMPTHIKKCAEQGDPQPQRGNYQYVGCYFDGPDRALPLKVGRMNLGSCHDACKARNFHYFGRQYNGECWCGGTTAADTSYAKHGETGSFEVEMSDECAPNCISWEGKNPETMAVNDPLVAQGYNYAAQYCSPLVDFSLYNSCTGTCSQPMSSHSSCSISSSSTENLGDGEYKLSFYGVVPSAPGGCCTANSCVGGKLETAPFTFDPSKHAGIEYKFFATGGGDWYEVIVAMYATHDTGYRFPVIAKCYRGSEITSPTLVQVPFTGSGQYIIVFYGGSYDASGGTVLGASINVQFFSTYLKSSRNLQESKSSSTTTEVQQKSQALSTPEVQQKRRRLSSGFKTQQCGDRCETMSIGSFLNCVYQIFYDAPPPVPSGATCSNLSDEFTSDFPPNELPATFTIPKHSDDPYAGYYDVQRCGTCNDWCGWVGTQDVVSPPNPWFQTETTSHFWSCKLAGGYSSSVYDQTERGYFEGSFPYQKCSGKGDSTPAYRKEKFIGCFADSSTSVLSHLVANGSNVPFYDCADTCRDKGYHYFGRQRNGQCRCSGTSVSDKSYAKMGEIHQSDSNYCGDCLGSAIGTNKNCVFKIIDQFDPVEERARHPCSHITLKDMRRYCYVSCRDKDDSPENLITCTSLSAMGLTELTKEISAWADSPLCDTKTCQKANHPLGGEVQQSKGTF